MTFAQWPRLTLVTSAQLDQFRPLYAEIIKVGRGHRNVGLGHLVRNGRGPISAIPDFNKILPGPQLRRLWLLAIIRQIACEYREVKVEKHIGNIWASFQIVNSWRISDRELYKWSIMSPWLWSVLRCLIAAWKPSSWQFAWVKMIFFFCVFFATTGSTKPYFYV